MTEPGISDTVRLHIWVTGRVQGVGFRSFVQQSGIQLNLTGWVRNVGDDKLETVAEGPRVQLEKLAKTVKCGPRAGRVEEASLEWETASGEFSNFSIKYGG